MSHPKLSFWSGLNITICFVWCWQQKVGSDVNIIILFFLRPPFSQSHIPPNINTPDFSLETEQRGWLWEIRLCSDNHLIIPLTDNISAPRSRFISKNIWKLPPSLPDPLQGAWPGGSRVWVIIMIMIIILCLIKYLQ